ncbi:MAG: hypothetical protein LBU24_03825 [Methanocalculaceae archaeon]|jgi:hypothetical protein|nr:hypothetical protein [Methanocalculaceae archaeon]
MKHLAAILLRGAPLFCGAVSAEATNLTINVYDSSAPLDPIKDGKVVITKDGLSQDI